MPPPGGLPQHEVDVGKAPQQTSAHGRLQTQRFLGILPKRSADVCQPPDRLYCCVVLDVFSRRVVSWSMDASPTGALVTNALGMAISSRNPDAGTLIQSDQGTQFTSWASTQSHVES